MSVAIAPGDLGAIILAGGRASRVDGAAKPLFEVGGQTLLGAAIDAARAAGAEPISVSGPELLASAGVHWVRERPAFGGPVAGLAAALDAWERDAVDPEWTLVLAADLPRVRAAVVILARGAFAEPIPSERDGACLIDSDGRAQWLTGIYRTASLRRAVGALADGGRDAPVRALMAGLRIDGVPDFGSLTADIDTWEDLERARQRAREEQSTVAEASRTLPPEALDEWALALRERFGLSADDVPVSLILDLARDVANGVARPAAPFSAFVAGLVAGRAGGSPDDIAEAVAAVAGLARDWQA